MAELKSNYWDKRAINRLTEAEKLSEKYINRVKEIYNQANKDIEKHISKIIEISNNFNISKKDILDLFDYIYRSDEEWKMQLKLRI